MKTVGTVTFPKKVIKYFEGNENRKEMQLKDGSVINRQKFNYSTKTIDIQVMLERGSIYHIYLWKIGL